MNRLTLPRMWGIKDAAEVLKQYDPHTGITAHYIKQLCLNNKIKFERVGDGKNAKYLVNMDSLLEYLSGIPSETKENTTTPLRAVR